MSYFIIVAGSGRGNLQMAFPGVTVKGLEHRLVSGPVPHSVDPADYSRCRKDLFEKHPDDFSYPEENSLHSDFSSEFLKIISIQEKYDEIHVWIDPSANALLVFCQLVSALKTVRGILQKVKCVFWPTPIPNTNQLELLTSPQFVHFKDLDENLFCNIFVAWSTPHPRLLADIFRDPRAEEFPTIQRYILRLIQEFPAVSNGLSASELYVLKKIRDERPSQNAILAALKDPLSPMVLDYWEMGRLLDIFLFCKKPVIRGVSKISRRFRILNETDRDRLAREIQLTVTDFGESLLSGNADFYLDNSLQRWLGGSKVTNETPWRWNELTQLIEMV